MKKYEEISRQASDRQALRKPQPKRPLNERVQAAIKYYEAQKDKQ